MNAGPINYRLGTFYAIATAILVSFQEPFCTLAARSLGSLDFMAFTQLALLLSVPLLILRAGSRISASRASSRSLPIGPSSSSSRTALTPTRYSAPTGQSRWSKTTRLRSMLKPQTATRAGPGSSSTLRPISDSAIRLTVNCLQGGRTPLSPMARAVLTLWLRRPASL
jgi:hypothetical protein